MNNITKKQWASFRKVTMSTDGITFNDAYNLAHFGITQKTNSTIRGYCMQIGGISWRQVTYKEITDALSGKEVRLMRLQMETI